MTPVYSQSYLANTRVEELPAAPHADSDPVAIVRTRMRRGVLHT